MSKSNNKFTMSSEAQDVASHYHLLQQPNIVYTSLCIIPVAILFKIHTISCAIRQSVNAWNMVSMARGNVPKYSKRTLAMWIGRGEASFWRQNANIQASRSKCMQMSHIYSYPTKIRRLVGLYPSGLWKLLNWPRMPHDHKKTWRKGTVTIYWNKNQSFVLVQRLSHLVERTRSGRPWSPTPGSTARQRAVPPRAWSQPPKTNHLPWPRWTMMNAKAAQWQCKAKWITKCRNYCHVNIPTGAFVCPIDTMHPLLLNHSPTVLTHRLGF